MHYSSKHWVFDLDGTLVDSFWLYLDTVRALLASFGETLTPEEELECLGHPPITFFQPRLGKDRMKILMDELRVRNKSSIHSIKTFPGIMPFLDFLKAQKAKMALFSSRESKSLHAILESTGLTDYFDLVVSGCCVKEHKPHPEGIEKIAMHFDCKASDIIFIGDHDVDVRAARAAGAFAIRACWHTYNPPKTCTYAHLALQKVDDLMQLDPSFFA